MRRALPALLLVAALGLTGCGGGDDSAPSDEPTGYSQEVRENFLASCVDNATRTAEGAASKEQLDQTCACILGKVEQEYSEAEFTEFEQRLLGGKATGEESDRLVAWSKDCAAEAAG